MADQDFARVARAPSQPSTAETPALVGRRGTSRYCRPRLTRVGSVVRLVQSGPIGNRYETYQGSYWSDR